MIATRPVGGTADPARALQLWLPLLAVLAVQMLLVGYTFPLSEVFTPTPILGIDHPFHLYQINLAMALAEQGRLTGYDPFFGAGYVGGVTFNASAKGPALLAWLLRGALGELQAYKLFVVIVAVLAPLAVTGAAVLARLSARQVWGCAAFAVALWWASAFHWYHTAGLVSFVAVSFAALPYCVLLNRLLDAPRAGRLVLLLGASGAVLFLMHPFFAIPVVFFGLVRLAVERPAIPFARWLGRMVAVGGICLLPNLPWLWAMHGQAYIGPSQYSINYQMLVDHRLFWMELLGLTSDPAKGAKIYPMLAILALWSLRNMDRPLRILCMASLGCWLALDLFAAFGAALPFIGPVQPNRFSATAYLFLVIPAAVGTRALVAAIRSPHVLQRYAAYACAGGVAVLAIAIVDEVRREASYAPSGRYGSAPPEVRGLGTKGQAILEWLRSETRPEGRVLFETSLARVHDGGHIVGYLAMQSGREFIGGPYNNFFAGTRDGWMFGRPLESIDQATFLAYLRLYNIGWIVVHSEKSKRYLAQFAGHVEPANRFEGLQTFVVKQELDFVQEGHASVRTAAYGKLVVDQRGTAGEPIVLKYHYVPGLRAVDGSPVEPVFLMDDPNPFIRVRPRGAVVELMR